MARTLTTVAQYEQFVASPDYANHFEGEGSQWLDGSYDSKISDDNLKKWLARRPKEQRNVPFEWKEQLANPLRPIVYVSWFEAQAYVHWLNASLGGRGLKGYRASLPTELQWECAARYSSDGVQSQRPFPWKDGPTVNADKQEFAQYANLGQMVGEPSTVGLHPKGHSEMGLADVVGNVWEWMGHAYVENYDPSKKIESQKASEYRALRGGSWINYPDFARCSFRNGYHPDYWINDFGFRVVLSLAN